MLYFLIGSGYGVLGTIAAIVAYLLVVTFSLSLHEFSHAFVAYRFGDNTPKIQGRLSINPARHIDPWGAACFLLVGFGWARPVQVNPLKFKNYKLAQSLVSLSGITVNLLLSFMFSGFLYFFGPALIASGNMFMNFLYFFLLFGFSINISLFVFNLIPVYPLDGFNFIRTFLSYNNKFVQFMFKYGSLIMFFIIITPIFDILYYYVTGGILSGFNWFWGLF